MFCYIAEASCHASCAKINLFTNVLKFNQQQKKDQDC